MQLRGSNVAAARDVNVLRQSIFDQITGRSIQLKRMKHIMRTAFGQRLR